VDNEFIDRDDFSDKSLAGESTMLTKHLFLPSGKFMWGIQSRKNNSIYYVDHDLTFCSCKGFYYNYSRKKCYHLSDVLNCIENSNFTVSLYEDRYFHQIIKRIVLDIISHY
jgi:predicted nucleic acid-binding Zn finger protein